MDIKNHLEKLNYFFEVAKTGSIKEASLKLRITQPSITKSIKILEEASEAKLFSRLPRGMKLTKKGEVLFNYCNNLFSGLHDLEQDLSTSEQLMNGTIRIGTYDSIAIYFWPQFFRSLLKEYPKLGLDLTTNRSQIIQRLVEQDELDLGLIIEPVKNQLSSSIHIAYDEFKLYETSSMTAIYQDIKTAPLIYMPESLTKEGHDQLSKILKIKNCLSGKVYKASSLETAKELAINGLGVALLPSMVAKSPLANDVLKAVSLKGFPEKGIGKHSLSIVLSKYRENSKVLSNIIEEIKNHQWN